MSRRTVFVADDFGMTSEINGAVLRTYQAGPLTAAALMMGQAGTAEAVAMAKANPGLQIGWHLHLNDSIPTTLSRWPWGASPARAGWSIALSPHSRKLMREEVARQWELYRKTGLSCHFINSHHHLHAHPLVLKTLVETVGPGFQGWIRQGQIRNFSTRISILNSSRFVDALFQRERKLSNWPSPDTLWGLDRQFAMRSGEVSAAVESLPATGFHEFLFHPRSLSCPDTRCLLELNSLSIT